MKSVLLYAVSSEPTFVFTNGVMVYICERVQLTDFHAQVWVSQALFYAAGHITATNL